jgi:hypothetical protein
LRAAPDLTVVICTRNRSSSLRTTLECLAQAEPPDVSVDVRVVDNHSSDDTREVTESFQGRLPITYLFEPALGTYGKSHALNCAIDHGGLSGLVAVLDDDMSPEPGWFKGVLSLSGRWPDKDFFTGRTPIIWPAQDVPGWAAMPEIRGWIFSAVDGGTRDTFLADGDWFLGGHFWFRSRVLDDGRRFKDIWLTEPDFMLQLVEDGFQGLAGPDAVAGHRIQAELLDPTLVRERAIIHGRALATVRVQPFRSRLKHAILLKRYPLLGRLFCCANALRWYVKLQLVKVAEPDDEHFVRELRALERFSNYRTLLAVADQVEDYRRWYCRPLAWLPSWLEKLPLP